MEQETPYISDFIRTLMPQAAQAEQLSAQRNLDRFLDAIDAIHARLERDGYYASQLEKMRYIGNSSSVS